MSGIDTTFPHQTGHLSWGSLALLGASDMHGGVSVVSPDSRAACRVAQGQCPGYKDGESGVSGKL
eukprot:3938639-Rhodomonas_salina.3